MSSDAARGVYVCLDGGDGTGKSTQAKRLAERLGAEGRSVLHLREPGSTRFGEGLRALLLDPATGELDPVTEVLAFSAARATMLREQVEPALAAGTDVVAERCCVSTLVYQCLAQPDPQGSLRELWHSVTARVHGQAPIDRLFVLDVDADTAAARRQGADDRIEARGLEYHRAVAVGFRSFVDDEAAQSGIVRSVTLVDASQSVDQVGETLRYGLRDLIPADDGGVRS